ncbi:MAG: aminotransferase class I/II-fold pyridoxal phosphate-dependent enzyme [Saprospiraceae bacterium]|nr:aminotransferase class I/II-fold pyridoxal phosphate-dependent enzyme [Saprospiraceae bacterium]
MKKLTIEQKRLLAKKLLEKRRLEKESKTETVKDETTYDDYTYDMFMYSMGKDPVEMDNFYKWVEGASKDGVYAFESARAHQQNTEILLKRETGEMLQMLNFSSYNYLGFGYHPEVKEAAKKAIDKFGLGANSSPVISGTFSVHKQLENKLLEYFGMEGYGVSLFSAGYSVNLGAISAFIKPGGHVVLDRAAHMSLLEGAELSKGEISYFRHNDIEHLEEVLKGIADGRSRILVCAEGIYSADGDYGNIKDICRVAKKYGAYVLVDEAHSTLLCGEHGRGVCEEQDVMDDVDMVVMTFSKSFSGVGGAVFAKKEITQYINWYAKCRMFSCALDPGVTGGMVKVLELAMSEEGKIRRKRIRENADYFRGILEGKVDFGTSESWIVPVLFGSEKNTLRLNDFMQRKGLDTSIMQFPAVAKNEARIRMFVTSEHTKEQLDKAAEIILLAADKFDFRIDKK